jgi:acyl-CoA thioester hydrolase
MTAEPIYRTPIDPQWIDYNGHLRDAYYGLILSLATDALMDRLGMDAPYRERTRCTLYTVEMHIHYLREVHKSDVVIVNATILGSDTKRIHAALQLGCEGRTEPAAAAEIMLLHIKQGDTPAVAPFAPDIARAIEQFREQSAGTPVGPGSRQMALRSRP